MTDQKQPKDPKWHESDFASLLGIAIVILALFAGLAGCNYIDKL